MFLLLSGATLLNPLESCSSARCKVVVSRRVHAPAAYVAQREHAIRARGDLSVRLTPIISRWVARLPADSPAAGVNFPVISLITKTFGYADSPFADDLAFGLPIARHVGTSNVPTSRNRNAASTVAAWRKDIPLRNKLLIVRNGHLARLIPTLVGWRYRRLVRVGLRRRRRFCSILWLRSR